MGATKRALMKVRRKGGRPTTGKNVASVPTFVKQKPETVEQIFARQQAALDESRRRAGLPVIDLRTVSYGDVDAMTKDIIEGGVRDRILVLSLDNPREEMRRALDRRAWAISRAGGRAEFAPLIRG